MTELVRYEAACRALAEAVAVDEVMTIRDQSEALRFAARVAKNLDLEVQAAKIRFRAERRLGELVKAQKETVGLNKGGRPRAPETRSSEEQVLPAPPTLAEAGIDRKLSSKAQRLADMDTEAFEAALARHEQDMRAGAGRIVMDLNKVAAEEKGREHRRNLAQVLSDTSAMTPVGRSYPCAYIDPPWRRNGGIGNRAYENHYPTMSWPEILAYLRRMRDVLLPDSWAFFWIPRAHLLALVEIEIEVTVAATGEVVLAKVDMPLGWAVAHALGMDSYSTCFVWTKTDEEHPDDSGSGLIAWDQDELLLLFKRGRGLPKPDGSEKFGSNHRERAGDHSRKPEFYRHMIASMVGTDADGKPLSVLEMFARVDAEHPLPPNWDACGNQSGERGLQPADVTPDGGVVLSEAESAIVERAFQEGIVQIGPQTIAVASPDQETSQAHGPAGIEAAAEDAPSHGGASSTLSTFDDSHLEIPAFLRRKPVDQGELDLARIDHAPAEIVDNSLQTRLPLTDDEIELQGALRAIDAGTEVPWSIVRQAIGAGYARATAQQIEVTDEGRAWLAQLVAPALPQTSMQEASL